MQDYRTQSYLNLKKKEPSYSYPSTQQISSGGGRFKTEGDKTGYASAGVTEIRTKEGYIIATQKPIINVSESFAQKVENIPVEQSSTSNNDFIKKEVVLSVRNLDGKESSQQKSIAFSYNRPKEFFRIASSSSKENQIVSNYKPFDDAIKGLENRESKMKEGFGRIKEMASFISSSRSGGLFPKTQYVFNLFGKGDFGKQVDKSFYENALGGTFGVGVMSSNVFDKYAVGGVALGLYKSYDINVSDLGWKAEVFPQTYLREMDSSKSGKLLFDSKYSEKFINADDKSFFLSSSLKSEASKQMFGVDLFKQVSPSSFNISEPSFKAGGISFSNVNPFQNSSGAEKLGTALFIGASIGLNYGSFKNNPLTRFTSKTFSSDYIANPRINFIEDYTQSMDVSLLKGLQGKKVSTIHVTTSNLPNEFITIAQPEFAGGFRRSIQAFNWYKSAPKNADVSLINVKGYQTNMRLTPKIESVTSTQDVLSGFSLSTKNVESYNRFVSTPNAYLGYAGIFKQGAKTSSLRTIVGNPDINLLLSRDFVSKSSKFSSLRETMQFQVGRSGKTFIPAENLFGRSIEGQLINPSKYVNAEGDFIKGFEGSLGTKVNLGKKKFSFYTQNLENPFQNSKLLAKPILKVGWDIFGTKQKFYKINIVETKYSKVGDVIRFNKVKDIIDIEKYNESYSYNRRYVNPSKSLAFFSSSSFGRNFSSSLSISSYKSSVLSSSFGSSRGVYSINSGVYSSGSSSSLFKSSGSSSSLFKSSGSKSFGSSNFKSFYSSKNIESPKIFSSVSKKGKERKSDSVFKLVDFNPKYIASVEASFFNIKGKKSSFSVMSGLGIRKIGG